MYWEEIIVYGLRSPTLQRTYNPDPNHSYFAYVA